VAICLAASIERVDPVENRDPLSCFNQDVRAVRFLPDSKPDFFFAFPCISLDDVG